MTGSTLNQQVDEAAICSKLSLDSGGVDFKVLLARKKKQRHQETNRPLMTIRMQWQQQTLGEAIEGKSTNMLPRTKHQGETFPL